MASPTPNDLTRQQLDELDTLLQRMLSLPLSKPEPVGMPPPPPPLPDLPPPAARPAARAAEPPFTPSFLPFPPARPEPAPPPRPMPLPPPPAVDHHFPDPSPAVEFVPAGTLRGVDEPALPYDFRRGDPDPVPLPPPPPVQMPEVNPFAVAPVEAAPPAPRPAPDRRPVPVFLWPVFVVNWLLEFVLGWFGPVGALLTRPATKTILGWAGVLLCVGAGALAARGMGWVAWPR